MTDPTETRSKGLSRRDFLKIAALGTAATGLAVTGLAPAPPTATAQEAIPTAAPEPNATPPKDFMVDVNADILNQKLPDTINFAFINADPTFQIRHRNTPESANGDCAGLYGFEQGLRVIAENTSSLFFTLTTDMAGGDIWYDENLAGQPLSVKGAAAESTASGRWDQMTQQIHENRNKDYSTLSTEEIQGMYSTYYTQTDIDFNQLDKKTSAKDVLSSMFTAFKTSVPANPLNSDLFKERTCHWRWKDTAGHMHDVLGVYQADGTMGWMYGGTSELKTEPPAVDTDVDLSVPLSFGAFLALNPGAGKNLQQMWYVLGYRDDKVAQCSVSVDRSTSPPAVFEYDMKRIAFDTSLGPVNYRVFSDGLTSMVHNSVTAHDETSVQVYNGVNQMARIEAKTVNPVLKLWLVDDINLPITIKGSNDPKPTPTPNAPEG